MVLADLFVIYSAPHPSEAKIHLRIQMYGTSPSYRLFRCTSLTCVRSTDNLSAISCLFKALDNLRNLFSSVDEAYQQALQCVPSFLTVP